MNYWNKIKSQISYHPQFINIGRLLNQSEKYFWQIDNISSTIDRAYLVLSIIEWSQSSKHSTFSIPYA